MADGKGPKSPGELNRAFDETLAAKVAESFTPTETMPAKPPQPTKTHRADTQRELKVVQETIEQLPQAAAKVAQTVAAPARSVTEHARELLQQQFGSDNEMRIYQQLATMGKDKGPNELAGKLHNAQELHIEAHNDLEEKPLP